MLCRAREVEKKNEKWRKGLPDEAPKVTAAKAIQSQEIRFAN